MGAALLLESETVAHWLGFHADLVAVRGMVLLAIGAGLVYAAQRQITRQILGIVAVLNLTFAVVSGLALVLAWNVFTNEGR